MEIRKRKLVDYFKKNLLKGYTEKSLYWALVKQGYTVTEVKRALDIANEELATKAPELKEKPTIRHTLIDINNKPIEIKKSFFRTLLDAFRN
jgi:hypothetical protein